MYVYMLYQKKIYARLYVFYQVLTIIIILSKKTIIIMDYGYRFSGALHPAFHTKKKSL